MLGGFEAFHALTGELDELDASELDGAALAGMDADALACALVRERRARAEVERLLEERSLALYRANETLRRRAVAAVTEIERCENTLFYESPIALIECDLSAVAEKLAALRAEGVRDIARWVALNPSAVNALAAAVTITSVNRAALRLVAARDVDALDQARARVFGRAFRRAFARYVVDVAEGRGDFQAQTSVRTLNRRTLDVLVRARPAVGRERGLEAVVCAFTDITEFKDVERSRDAARAAAEDADASHARFVAAACQEIRSPLNAIARLVGALEYDRLTPSQRDTVKLIRRADEELQGVIHGVQDLARARAGQFVVSHEPVDLAAWGAAADQFWRPVAEDHGVGFTFELDAPEDAAEIAFDARRVRQILNNLLSNAFRFTAEGEVRARVSLCGAGPGALGVLRIEVSDTGCGFDGAVLERLWTRFDRAEAGLWRREGGGGLSLAIVKTLAEKMGGRAGAQSAPGEGSTFFVELPCAAAEGPRVANGGDALPGAPRLLAAQRDMLGQRVLSAMLSALSMRADIVSDGEAAVAAAQSGAYDVILLDVKLPRLSGGEAARRIRALEEPGRRTPIIAITADAGLERREELFGQGFDDLMPRPIDGVALARMLARWTDKPDAASDESL